MSSVTRWPLALLVLMLLSAQACSDGDVVADTRGSGSAPASSSAARSDEALAAAWWTWAMSEPDSTNPVVDDTGEDCARNQPADVWFLAGTFGGRATRTCSIPAGRELFFPIVNFICPSLDRCGAPLDNTQTRVVVDGRGVTPYEINAGSVEVVARRGNSVNGLSGRFRVAVSGWWVRHPPLNSGSHRIEFAGRTTTGFTVSVVYDVTVR